MASGGKRKGRKKRNRKPQQDGVARMLKRRAAARKAVERKAKTVAGRRAELEEIKAEAATLPEIPADVRDEIAENERWLADEEATVARFRAELADLERVADDFLRARSGS